MTFCLNTTIVKPEEGEEIKNAVILLHGYGGDGKDISMLTLNWKRFLKNTVFLCPDGHETCPINPCLLYTSPSPRDLSTSRMPSSA